VSGRKWIKLSHEEIKTRVFKALEGNVNYDKQNVIGIPASYLDDKIFSQDASFLNDAPFISTLVKNPNHIGCHTLGNSESFFAGTQEIEKELIEICAVDILKGDSGQVDGYVASGGTEANLQALWVYRNYFMREHNAASDEICIFCSEDSHYSMDKGADILAIDISKVPVDDRTREISIEKISDTLKNAQAAGKKYFIIVVNMMTTMYGSVDNIDSYLEAFRSSGCQFRIHVDGAFGGFYYPFTKHDNTLQFSNSDITSFTLDAHKMAQAPYGTGIFLIRKNFIQYAETQEASYVKGNDYTLIGSRSGANAIAVWMILMKNGPYGWQEKVFILQKRTEWMCGQLNDLGVEFYRHARSNIITIRSKCIDSVTATDFGLVPDNHTNPVWYKIVIMEHVTIEKLIPLIDKMKALARVSQSESDQ
jgi:tyrosine decarboxylase / aspartate 1-decarboxylase